MKDYRFKIKVQKETTEEPVTIERKVKLCIDDDFTMESILTFEKNLKKALSEVRKAAGSNDYVTVRLTISTYDGWQNDTKELTQKSFDCWQYVDYLQDTNGLYLPADTQYTDPALDLWIDYNSPMESIMDK